MQLWYPRHRHKYISTRRWFWLEHFLDSILSHRPVEFPQREMWPRNLNWSSRKGMSVGRNKPLTARLIDWQPKWQPKWLTNKAGYTAIQSWTVGQEQWCENPSQFKSDGRTDTLWCRVACALSWTCNLYSPPCSHDLILSRGKPNLSCTHKYVSASRIDLGGMKERKMDAKET